MKANIGLRVIFAMFGVMLVVQAGSAQQASPRLAAKQVVIHGIAAGDINSFDPGFSGTSQDMPIMAAVMEGLVTYPPGEISTNFQPALAERWTVSADGRTYTFYLRKGVTFHEGFGPFTAADVEYSLGRYRDPKESAWAAQYSTIDAVKVIDSHTVAVTLKAPDPFFLGRVATDNDSGSFMLSKKAFEQRGKAAMRLQPIGTGPFKFVEYRTKDRVILARNDDYWGGKPILEQIVYRYMPSTPARELALVNGEIHSMRCPIDAKLLDRLKRQGMVITPFGPQTVWLLHMNITAKPFDDVRVRRAVAHAIKREDLVAYMGKDLAEPLFSPIPPTYVGAAKRGDLPAELRHDYDPDKAKALLKEAGLPNGFEVTMKISERGDYRELMTILQQHLKQVGINVQLELVDHTTYHSQGMKDATKPLFLIGDLSYPDGFIMLKRFYHSSLALGKPTSARNYSRYENPQVDGWLAEAERSADLDKRRQIYMQIQRKVLEDITVAPIVVVNQPGVRRPELDLGYELRSSLVLETRFTKDTRLIQR
jgi:peptide/nickel transport system substrate-binding protein